MASPFNTGQSLASSAWKGTFGVNNYHIYHGSLEMMLCKFPDGNILGDYINHDGWFDFTEREAKLAYEAYGCDSIYLPKKGESTFMPMHIDDTAFEKVFLFE